MENTKSILEKGTRSKYVHKSDLIFTIFPSYPNLASSQTFFSQLTYRHIIYPAYSRFKKNSSRNGSLYNKLKNFK